MDAMTAMNGMDEEDEYANSPSSSGSRSSSKLEIRWSSLKLDKSVLIESDMQSEHKYDDSLASMELDMNAKRGGVRKRRWSRELEVVVCLCVASVSLKKLLNVKNNGISFSWNHKETVHRF